MMTDRRQISAKVSVGGQPTAAELGGLREQGFATVVNLRLPGEPGQLLAPDDEKAAAAEAGLAYRHIPVSLAELDAAQVDELRAAIDTSTGPVYVHCGAGQRACSLGLLATSTGGDLAARAAELGLPATDERLVRFVAEQSERERLRLLQAI
jgi:uncharacterized protein (TIGR01244 family)